eukprot:2228641-Rhodomonas_salina.2
MSVPGTLRRAEGGVTVCGVLVLVLVPRVPGYTYPPFASNTRVSAAACIHSGCIMFPIPGTRVPGYPGTRRHSLKIITDGGRHSYTSTRVPGTQTHTQPGHGYRTEAVNQCDLLMWLSASQAKFRAVVDNPYSLLQWHCIVHPKNWHSSHSRNAHPTLLGTVPGCQVPG